MFRSLFIYFKSRYTPSKEIFLNLINKVQETDWKWFLIHKANSTVLCFCLTSPQKLNILSLCLLETWPKIIKTYMNCHSSGFHFGFLKAWLQSKLQIINESSALCGLEQLIVIRVTEMPLFPNFFIFKYLGYFICSSRMVANNIILNILQKSNMLGFY